LERKIEPTHINCNMGVHKPIWKKAGEKTPSYGFIDIEKDKGLCRINNRKNDRFEMIRR